MVKRGILVLLPGLGATAELFAPQQAFFGDLHVPEWLPHHAGESLPDYAQRMATTLPNLVGQRFYLGGISFGGMVAQEMVRHLPATPSALFLIASGRSGACIAPHLTYFVRFASFLPERAFDAGHALTPLFLQKFGRLSPEQEEWFGAMLAGVDAKFVRWGIEAITNWSGCALPPNVPVHHIHGGDDELIPRAQVEPDKVVPGGGHLLNVTHAAEVNRFIAERMT